MMAGAGAALLELYAAFGEPWWVGPLAMAAVSCRGIGLGKVLQRTREAVSPVAMTGEEWEELQDTGGAPVSGGALRTGSNTVGSSNEIIIIIIIIIIVKTTEISFPVALSSYWTGHFRGLGPPSMRFVGSGLKRL